VLHSRKSKTADLLARSHLQECFLCPAKCFALILFSRHPIKIKIAQKCKLMAFLEKSENTSQLGPHFPMATIQVQNLLSPLYRA
jgi:hypothetical protein